jgi:predicted ATP-grasp superfamily ATP-dependent carboligase
LKAILYEHVSGGGYAGHHISPDFLAEGFAMLRTAASDFKAAGHHVTVLLDDRISKLNPPINADCTVPIIYPEETTKFLTNLASINDASYIIAPETGQILESYVALMEKTGKISLNSQSNAIKQVANKANLQKVLEINRVNIPDSFVFSIDENLTSVKKLIKEKLCYPIIFKPAIGVSCSGLSIVNNDSQIISAIEKIKAESSAKHFIVQEFIIGEAVSVSLLVSNGKALAISLNKQNVNVALPNKTSSYLGGCVPFDNSLKEETFLMAEKAVECFSGLKGYVGVDFVLGKDKPFVVDVNPRLTTSYVGLSQTVGFNVAQALIDAISRSRLPTNFETKGFTCFEKVESTKPTEAAFKQLSKVCAVVSPPFTLADSDKAVSMIDGHGRSLKQAGLHLEEAKKCLLDIVG